MTAPQTTSLSFADGIQVIGPMAPGYNEILTPEAMAFVTTLNRTFNGRRIALLERRAERQQAFDAGQMPDFLPETAESSTRSTPAPGSSWLTSRTPTRRPGPT